MGTYTRRREPGANGARGADGVVKLRQMPVELRATADGAEGVLEGYASIYDVEYRIGYGLNEAIAEGAFDRSILDQNSVIPIFYMHDWDNPIGFAKVTSDAKGVRVVATLFIAENERARSVWLAAKAGALRQWSIGFYPTTIELRMNDDGTELETITEGDLAEASVVVRGANPATEMIDVRSRTEWTDERATEAEAAFYRAAVGDPDDDPGRIAQAIDAANDALCAALAAGEYETAAALCDAVDMAVDRLLVLFGVNDPDETEETEQASTVPSYMLDAIDRPWLREWLRPADA